GAPGDLYDYPANQFVAGFIGSPAMNFFPDATLEQQGGHLWLRLAEGVSLQAPEELAVRAAGYLGRQVTVGIRPEHLEEGQAARRRAGEAGEAAVAGRVARARVDVVEHLGNEQMVYGVLAGKQVLARVEARSPIHPGDEIELVFDMSRLHLFDPADEHCITSRPPEPSPVTLEAAGIETSGDGTATEAEQSLAVEAAIEIVESNPPPGDAS
ncbi:MAG TPA: TOBE domain-containing protein, partial [Ktedonobacterales bacterium]